MRDKMQTGRCYKLPVQTAVKSKFETISRVRDIQGCVIEKKNLKLSSIRFEVQKECDGDKTWFATARNLVEASKIRVYTYALSIQFKIILNNPVFCYSLNY